MASTTALQSGLSGLSAYSRQLDVIGNNIANVNTTSFKSSRMLLAPQAARTFSIGSPPSDVSGGTNPGQVGLGVGIAGTQRDMRAGSLSVTGDSRDLAIEGDGFFIVDRAGTDMYTRAGAFRPNAEGKLVTITGDLLRGFGVDDEFNVVEGELVNIEIPLGTLTIAQTTTLVRFDGNLNAGGSVATHGSSLTLGSGEDAGFTLLSTATLPATSPNILESTSLLSEIEDPEDAGVALFGVGRLIEIGGAEKGSRILDASTFEIADTSTVQDLMDFLSEALGIRTDLGANPDGSTPGVSLDPLTGILSIIGNTGEVNDLQIESTDIRLLESDGTLVRSPFVADTLAEADGESVRTTFVVFDSLGAPVSVDIALTLESKTSTGTTWRYDVESGDDSDADPRITSGTLSFDTLGRLESGTSDTISIDRDGTGAGSPLAVTLEFTSDADTLTSYVSASSSVAATYQDGSPLGTLSNFGVGPDGLISGSFSNGLTRTLGRVALATFRNPEGLVEEGSNLFSIGPNSGSAVVTRATEFGTGRVVSGALELSNVDLGAEFINMILTSTGYSASSRVIRATDELLQQLLVIGR